MKYIINCMFLFVILVPYLKGQSAAYNFVSNNKVMAGMHSDGTLFMNEEKDAAGFEVYNEETAEFVGTIFSSSLWLAGIGEDGTYNSSSMSYSGLDGKGTFGWGPYNNNVIDFDFNRVWKIEGKDIELLIDDHQDGNIDNQPSLSLLEWPGSGNPYYNGKLPAQDLAPFFDYNSDGIYDPFDGDYPVINESNQDVIPSEMIFSIYHDYTASFTNPLQIEIHSLLYVFSCEENEVLNNSLFSKHRIIKKGEAAFGCVVGLWTDNDLGCYSDDAIGVFPEKDLFISYNIDPIDGDLEGICMGPLESFGDNPGVKSTIFLNQTLSSYIANISTNVSAPVATYHPESPEEYFNNLNGLWRDGTPITFGNNGYNPASSDDVKFLFSGDPADSDEWSMHALDITAGVYQPIASTTIGDMSIEDDFVLDIVHVYSQSEDLNNIEIIDENLSSSEDIRNLYNQDFSNSCALYTSTKIESESSLSIRPNPVNNIIYLDSDISIHSLAIVDSKGREILKIDEKIKSIDTSFLSAGIYVLVIQESKSAKVFVKRFVKI